MAGRQRVRMVDIDGQPIIEPLTPDEIDEWREVVSMMDDDSSATAYDVRRFLATFDQVVAVDKPVEGSTRYRLVDRSGMPVQVAHDGTVAIPADGAYWIRLVEQ